MVDPIGAFLAIVSFIVAIITGIFYKRRSNQQPPGQSESETKNLINNTTSDESVAGEDDLHEIVEISNNHDHLNEDPVDNGNDKRQPQQAHGHGLNNFQSLAATDTSDTISTLMLQNDKLSDDRVPKDPKKSNKSNNTDDNDSKLDAINKRHLQSGFGHAIGGNNRNYDYIIIDVNTNSNSQQGINSNTHHTDSKQTTTNAKKSTQDAPGHGLSNNMTDNNLTYHQSDYNTVSIPIADDDSIKRDSSIIISGLDESECTSKRKFKKYFFFKCKLRPKSIFNPKEMQRIPNLDRNEITPRDLLVVFKSPQKVDLFIARFEAADSKGHIPSNISIRRGLN